MNQSDFTLVGMVAMLTIAMTREVLNFFDKKKGNKKLGNPIDFDTLDRRVKEIHIWNERIAAGMERQEKLLERAAESLSRIEIYLGKK